MGTCIDTFHKNPAHQRGLLSDPGKLPIRTEISIGDLKVSLLVNGSFDRKGKYIGNILEWMDVSTIRLNEGMLAAINKSQAVIEFTTDGKVIHANENFLKALGYSMDEIRGRHHSMFVEPRQRESVSGAATVLAGARHRATTLGAEQLTFRLSRRILVEPGGIEPPTS